jgi:hypothetical protein
VKKHVPYSTRFSRVPGTPLRFSAGHFAYDYTVKGFTAETWLTHIRDYVGGERLAGADDSA